MSRPRLSAKNAPKPARAGRSRSTGGRRGRGRRGEPRSRARTSPAAGASRRRAAPEELETRLKLFVALDGSEASARAVDHVGRLVRSGGDVAVTLFHACPEPPARLETGGAEDPRRECAIESEQKARLREWQGRSRDRVEQEIFAPARRVLAAAGLPERAMEIRSRFYADAHPQIPRVIVEEAAAAGADAIVMGRSGRSRLKELALGSVSSRVLEQLSRGAVWIVE